MSTFYFLRHGETDDLANNIVQSPSSALSEKGRNQVKSVIPYLKKVHLDKILCSPLARTKQTAAILNEELRLDIENVDELEEEKRPSILMGRSKNDKEVVKILADMESNYTNPAYRYSDEDTFDILKSNTIKLRSKLETYGKGDYLLVSHGNIRRMFLGLTLFGNNLTSEAFVNLNYSTNNDPMSLCVFKHDSSEWKLDRWNAPTILL